MDDPQIARQVSQFCEEYHVINMVYEDYARTLDISYTSLQILTMIMFTEECTQKVICEKTFLPKQTVNAVITGFYKKGIVELRELPSDRRNKTIHLTKEGTAYAEQIVPKIRKAEYAAFEKLTSEQRENLLEAIRIYRIGFREAMLGEANNQ